MNYNFSLMIELVLTDKPEDFEQIIALQKKNHISQVDQQLWETEGFVTLEFDIDKLEQIRGQYFHVVAKSGNKLAGYALVMLPASRGRFHFLEPMFATIEAAVFKGEPVKGKKYFVMGQICVDSDFRNKGVFRELYYKLREQMRQDFDFVVTEVSVKNSRSVSAHKQLGFRNINDQQTEITANDWEVIAWDWQ